MPYVAYGVRLKNGANGAAYINDSIECGEGGRTALRC